MTLCLPRFSGVAHSLPSLNTLPVLAAALSMLYISSYLCVDLSDRATHQVPEHALIWRVTLPEEAVEMDLECPL